MKRRHSTIKDIAKALQISVATVSRAMRDTYDVSKETRERVLEMAQRLNYRPNLNAQGLVRRSTRNIGVIIPTITNYYFSTVVMGIQEAAQKNGFNIILYLTNDSPELELQLIQNLSLNSLDGLLICVSSRIDSSTHFHQISEEGLPVVYFDRVLDGIAASKVMQDDYNGAFMAVSHLIERGYKRIAHITGPKELFFTQNRLIGYIEALKSNKLPVDETLIIHSGFSQKAGEEDIEILFDKNSNVPDAIFAVNDRKAIGAILALKKRNIEVGKMVGVIGFTNDPICEIISPTLSTVAEPAYQIGQSSCNLLINHINKPNFQVQEVVLSGELVIRESTKRSEF